MSTKRSLVGVHLHGAMPNREDDAALLAADRMVSPWRVDDEGSGFIRSLVVLLGAG